MMVWNFYSESQVSIPIGFVLLLTLYLGKVINLPFLLQLTCVKKNIFSKDSCNIKKYSRFK